MTDLTELTCELGEASVEKKKWEAQHKELRKEFLDAADEILAEETQAMKTITVPTTVSMEDAEDYVLRYNPGWILANECQNIGGAWKITIKEDPHFRPFAYVNQKDRQVYTKQVASGSLELDDDRLKEENPELWEWVTEEVTERKLKPLETLPDPTLAELQEFMYEGKRTIKLGPVRSATPEELDGQAS